jgi:hypothetical protein
MGHVDAIDYTLTFPDYIQINGPDSPADAPAWLVAMQNYRTQQRASLELRRFSLSISLLELDTAQSDSATGNGP